MKHAIPTFAGFVAIGLLGSTAPGFAGQLPQGSYRDSCRDARMVGHTLLATCRQPDGEYWGISGLAAVQSCTGGIVNRTGELYCARDPLYGSNRAREQQQGSRRPDRAQGL